MAKRILYIAYHFPPIQVSSGVHRTLAFTRYLAGQGNNVTVLTVNSKAYISAAEHNQKLIPENVNVIRAYARDTARHYAFKGRYLGAMALPDRWQSWIIGGVISGLKHIKQQRPDVIVSTYPIASAHIIGYLLHKITGVPWIADFRDPMLQVDYPHGKALRTIFGWVERKAVKHCKHIIFTSPGAVELYRQRYPQVADSVWQIMPNGYDETMFRLAETAKPATEQASAKANQLTLLHSGTIYPSERDPSHFFSAVAAFKKRYPHLAANLRVKLRSTGHDDIFRPALEQHGIADIVQLLPALNYVDAVEEMLTVDALLLMQADNCNYQIPAKAYEYIRAKKPILALTDPAGDTAGLIKKTQVALIAPLNDATAIENALHELLIAFEQKQFNFLSDNEISLYSREYQAKQLADLIAAL